MVTFQLAEHLIIAFLMMGEEGVVVALLLSSNENLAGLSFLARDTLAFIPL